MGEASAGGWLRLPHYCRNRLPVTEPRISMRSVPPVLRWAGHGAPPDQHVDLYEAVKYDTRLHGTRFIITEFAAATLGSGLLGGFEVFRLDRTLPTVLTGLWFLGVSLNSLAVVALARHATRHGMAAQLGARRLQLSAMAG